MANPSLPLVSSFSARMSAHPTHKIFLLDDNTIDRETCRRHLARVATANYVFAEHNSIDGALERVQQEEPDCILLDYHLHDGTGLQFLESLNAIGGPWKCPVVMLTGTGNEAIAVKVMKIGAQDYLSKDNLSPEGLHRAIETAIYKTRVESETRALRTRIDAALIAGEIGTWVWEIETDQVFADANLARFFTVTAEEANGGPVNRYLEAIHPDDRERVSELIRAALEHDSQFEAEYRVESTSGTRWVSARGRIERNGEGKAIRLPGVVLDITERKRALSDLQTTQERFGLAIDAAELGTFYCPIPLATIIWNDRCKEHFWLPPDASIDIDLFYAILHPDDRERTKHAIEQALANKTLYDVEYRTVSPKQDIRWIRAMGKGFYDEGGELTRFDGITIDISDKKRTEHMLQEALEAEQSARHEAELSGRLKDDFLATLSHELRTPLNAVLGWVQVMRATPQTAEDLEQGLAVIERNARAQTQIIEDLLEMSRIISGKIRLDVQRFDLSEIVEAAVETVRPSAEAKEIRIQIVLDASRRTMNGDPNRMQQVFWNLLSNAIKFTPKGGRVQVVLQFVNSHVEVHVTDTGCGISESFLPHVFDRFRQADGSTTRVHGGLGLGLAISRQLVELHGGSVRVESEGEGKGSSFTVVLPVIALREHKDFSEPEVSRLTTNPTLLSSIIGELKLNGIRVLVVEDESSSRELVARLLTDCGANVIVAASAEEALVLFQERRPDVLISDIGMPGQDGYELIKRIRDSEKIAGLTPVPAIALTAYARAEDRMKAIRAGFQAHVAKPVEGAELLTMVASVTNRMMSIK